MAYIFTLHLKKETSALTLLQDGKKVGEKSWPEARDMGRQLFEALAELLKEHKLMPEMVSDFLVESELPEIYTSARIAETVKRVYAFGVKVKNK